MTRSKLIGLLAVLGTTAVLAVGVPGALAAAPDDPDYVFACYSKGQTDPGVWPKTEASVFSSWTTYAEGYWGPWATKSSVSMTKLGDYYLTCAMPEGMKLSGDYIGSGGESVPARAPWVMDGSPILGVYPVVS